MSARPERPAVIRLLNRGWADVAIAKYLRLPAIYPKCVRQQLGMEPNSPRNRPWTEAERVAVIVNYTAPRPRPTLLQLARRLGRTIASIKQEAGKLRKAGRLTTRKHQKSTR